MTELTSELTSVSTDAAVLVETAQAAVEPHEIDPRKVYSVVVPSGSSVETIDMEDELPHPRRKRGRVRVYDADSFTNYWTRHFESSSVMYKDDTGKPVLIGVLDDHDDLKAGWGHHRVVLETRRTEQWEAWLKNDGQWLDQTVFAEHIENNIDDCRIPSGAELLELAQTFQATTKVEFKSASRLSNGERQLVYVEQIEASGGAKGEMTIPKELQLGIAPFEGGDAYGIVARLRHRIYDGKLKIGYVLNRPKDVEKHAFSEIVDKVELSTGETALYGVPR